MFYGEKLKNLREEQDVMQKDLAKLLNISRSMVGRYENEYVIIPLKHLIKICDYFNVSLDYIFNFTNIKHYSLDKKGLIKDKLKVRIKEVRLDKNLTQSELADILNVSTSVIAGAEQGRRSIATPFLYDLCKKYNVSADYLLGRIDEPKYLK